MIPVSATTLAAIAPHRLGQSLLTQAEIVRTVGALLQEILPCYGINTPLRIAHFLGQCCHESDGFSTLEEYDTGDAYEGREDLGNDEPGDGRKYKGHGLIQTTGKANHYRAADKFGVPRDKIAAWLCTPRGALAGACFFWDSAGCNRLADDDDIIRLTRRINGGQNGLQDRIERTRLAKSEVAGLVAGEKVGTHLHRGCQRGAMVTLLQLALRNAGYPVAVDGDFGPATELAVVMAQRAHGMTADGTAGSELLAALGRAA